MTLCASSRGSAIRCCESTTVTSSRNDHHYRFHINQLCLHAITDHTQKQGNTCTMNIQNLSHLPINPMFTTAPDLLADLHELHSLMDAEETKLINRRNPYAPFELYTFYSKEKPQYKALIDSFYMEKGICPQLASIYPDASAEVAFLQPNQIPPTILCSNSHPDQPQISESALWWMQTYGSHGNRLSCFEKCISFVKKIISRFENTVPPFQRCHQRLIPTLLSKSKFQSLSNALVDAYSIYLESGVVDDSSRIRMNISSCTTNRHQQALPPAIPGEVITHVEDSASHSELSETLVPTHAFKEMSVHQEIIHGQPGLSSSEHSSTNTISHGNTPTKESNNNIADENNQNEELVPRDNHPVQPTAATLPEIHVAPEAVKETAATTTARPVVALPASKMNPVQPTMATLPEIHVAPEAVKETAASTTALPVLAPPASKMNTRSQNRSLLSKGGIIVKHHPSTKQKRDNSKPHNATSSKKQHTISYAFEEEWKLHILSVPKKMADQFEKSKAMSKPSLFPLSSQSQCSSGEHYIGVPYTQTMEAYEPTNSEDDTDPIRREFVSILEKLPKFIQNHWLFQELSQVFQVALWNDKQIWI
jgi:hypothetical protein